MYKLFFKRAIDIVLSLIVLPFVLLAIIFIAPAVYINDPGPVFYIANRRGKGGKSFKMLKFRSMYVNSPDIRNSDGSTFNGKNDPRVTKIGRILRETSLDEIPQFLNVLVGDMSFIGPRPSLATRPLSEVPEYARRRFAMRPGITGYSQAYFRNSITQQQKIENDIYYCENVSFVMDCKIVIQTIKTVLKHSSIYVESTSETAANDKELVNK